MTEAFPWDTAPRYLLRDRDASYGQGFRDRVHAMGIKEVVTAPDHPGRTPTSSASLARSAASECLDYVVIVNERHLRRVLSSYVQYYHRARTHLSLNKDCPEIRPAHTTAGKIIACPEVGGLHHRYERRPA